MSLSPSKVNARPKVNARNRSKSASPDPLTLSQALLITAGLAGIVGLGSGAFLRFALAHSPNTRSLSPLQTFPALSNWTPELPQKTADSHYLPGGGSGYEKGSDRPAPDAPQANSNILTFEPAAPIDSNQSSPMGNSLSTEITVDSKSAATKTFDAFAARSKRRPRPAAPLDLLKKGPDLGSLRQRERQREPSRAKGGLRSGENSQGNIYDDSERYATDSDSYSNGDDNRGYGDNYYPPTDESVESSDAYYDGTQR